MTPERWSRASELLLAALEQPEERRAGWLAAACGHDLALRSEVQSLLDAHAGASDALDGRAASVAAGLLDTAGGPESAATRQAPGARVGPYRLVSEIGRGGMGSVHLAERADGQFEQRVALKLVRAGLDGERVLRAFRRERQILAKLEHPHIARLLDGGLTPDGLPYFVMEYVEGEPITTHCGRRGLPVEERLRLFLDVCEAVDAAHAGHVVHRDLKPSNVLVNTAGEVKLLDFGIAKQLDAEAADHARTETLAMTPLYAAPEQVRREPATTATDVYALGLLLYELLTGKLAHRVRREGTDELLRVILEQEPERPSTAVTHPDLEAATDPPGPSVSTDGLRRRLRGDLDNIVLKALQKEPARRYASAAAFAEDVRRHLAGMPVTARPSSLAYRARKLVGRRRAAATAAGIGALALAVAAAALVGARRARERSLAVPIEFRLVSDFPGSHRAPSFSSDGTRIAYVDFGRGGAPQIWTLDLRGGEPRQRTFGDDPAGRPRWSPRDDVIVFERGRQGIWSVPATGGEARQILKDGKTPNLSADGARIVFERSGHGIWLAHADGSEAREVKGVPPSPFLNFVDLAPALSPDGQWIAFFRCEFGPNGDLWVLPSAGGTARQLTHDLRLGGGPVWTPDGGSIVYSSARAGSLTLWKVPLAGGPPIRVTTGSGDDIDADIDASGKRLIYTNARNSYAIVRLDPASGSEHVLLERKTVMVNAQASPDGRRIAFFGHSNDGSQVFTVNADGSDVRQITQGAGFHVYPYWSADGRELYYFEERPDRGLRRIAAGGGPSASLMPGWGLMSWARLEPAGRRAVYNAGSRWEPSATLVRDLIGGDEHPLPVTLLNMAWSPDGQDVVGFDQQRTLTLCPADGKACTTLGTGHSATFAGNDSQHIYFLRGPRPLDDPTIGAVKVFVVDRDGKNEKQLADLAPILVYTKSLGVTPDGRILWTKLLRGQHQLWIADLP